jgi:hypothetical protein
MDNHRTLLAITMLKRRDGQRVRIAPSGRVSGTAGVAFHFNGGFLITLFSPFFRSRTVASTLDFAI